MFAHRLVALSLLLLPLQLGAGWASAEDLAPGSRAPAFSLPGSDGRNHSLADHLGRQGVVLAWFPKAFTPG